jgi:LacI family transcriptional regulator
MPRTTIKDIAKECDVSLSTVSLVLNGNPRISAATREKVMAAVDRHGYQPNAFARSLASRSSRAFSVVVPHLNHVFADVYFGEIVSGIYEYATSQGYKVLLDMADQHFVKTHEYVNLLKSRRVDGMLFIGSSIHDDYLFDLDPETYPLILVNHYFPDQKINYIAADYVSSAQLAAKHLTGLGHRAIGLLAGTNTHTAQDFQKHFIADCQAMGCKEQDLPWADGWFTEQGGYEGAEWLLTRFPHLTALMAGNDKMAIGAIRYLTKKRLRVPEDVSVMGMDDIRTAEFVSPSLTTIRHDLYRIGQEAVKGLTSLFRHEIESCRQVLPVSLVERDSTGPVRK